MTMTIITVFITNKITNNLIHTNMKKFYFFNSSWKSENCPLSIWAASAHSAFCLALRYMLEHGYKGSPMRIVI